MYHNLNLNKVKAIFITPLGHLKKELSYARLIFTGDSVFTDGVVCIFNTFVTKDILYL